MPSDVIVSKFVLATPWHYFCRNQQDCMLKLSAFTTKIFFDKTFKWSESKN